MDVFWISFSIINSFKMLPCGFLRLKIFKIACRIASCFVLSAKTDNPNLVTSSLLRDRILVEVAFLNLKKRIKTNYRHLAPLP